MTARDAFLSRVRTAVQEGNRAGTVPPLPDHSLVGYQGSGPDPVERFLAEIGAAGGKGHVVSSGEGVIRTVQSILQQANARRVTLSRGGLVERLGLVSKLQHLGYDARLNEGLIASHRDDTFAAEVGITNVYRLIAETGTVVVAATPNEPRSTSLLPPVHIAIADRSQLLPDLFDLFDLFAPTASPQKSLPPSCLTLITGPSKTGDIELRLVTGVHGPGEVHVILLNE